MKFAKGSLCRVGTSLLFLNAGIASAKGIEKPISALLGDWQSEMEDGQVFKASVKKGAQLGTLSTLATSSQDDEGKVKNQSFELIRRKDHYFLSEGATGASAFVLESADKDTLKFVRLVSQKTDSQITDWSEQMILSPVKNQGFTLKVVVGEKICSKVDGTEKTLCAEPTTVSYKMKRGGL